jgi:cytochrome b6-f complex iron-sulfur subunit
MKRSDFFSALGISAGTVIFAPFLASCSKSTNLTPDPQAGPGGSGVIDFTLDLTQPAHSALNSNGGSLLKSGVIIARTTTGAFVAIASTCTHQGTTIDFDYANNRFHCSGHGSNFSTNGSVINGPATIALKMYNTQLTGTSLRIYA